MPASWFEQQNQQDVSSQSRDGKVPLLQVQGAWRSTGFVLSSDELHGLPSCCGVVPVCRRSRSDLGEVRRETELISTPVTTPATPDCGYIQGQLGQQKQRKPRKKRGFLGFGCFRNPMLYPLSYSPKSSSSISASHPWLCSQRTAF